VYSLGEWGAWTRNVFVGDDDSIGEPGSPPAERPYRDHTVVTQRRDGQVDGCRVPVREDHVQLGEVLATPQHVVAEDDELNAF